MRERGIPIRHGHHGNLRANLGDKSHIDFCVHIVQDTNTLVIILYAKRLALKCKPQASEHGRKEKEKETRAGTDQGHVMVTTGTRARL